MPGGTGRYSFEIAAALARVRGLKVTGFVAAHRDASAAKVPGVLGPRRLPLPRRALTAAWERGVPAYFRDIDLLHAPTLLMPHRANVPIVVTIHDAVPWTHPSTLTERGVRWHRSQAEYAATHAAAITVPTHAVAGELREHLDIAVPLHVVGLGVSTQMAAGGPPLPELPERYVICVATLEPRKGLAVLMAALTDRRLADVPLVLVGQPGWGGVDLDEAARRTGLDLDRVIVTGRLDDARLSRAIANAEVLVQPSRSEGFGIPVLEAMTLGTPVIHTDAPALVEVAGGAGVQIPREDNEALAGALVQVLSDGPLRERLSAAGKKRAQDYSWDRSAEQLVTIYDEVARGE
ncbi:glycosyltransferase family 1 protein [Epidermidibacterium keratini]